MDWDRYKQLSDQPNVFSRWMLERSSALLGDPDRELVRRALAGPALAKPSDHKGGAETDMFQLELCVELRRRIVVAVEAAKREGRTTYDGGGLGGFVEAWVEYRDWEL